MTDSRVSVSFFSRCLLLGAMAAAPAMAVDYAASAAVLQVPLPSGWTTAQVYDQEMAANGWMAVTVIRDGDTNLPGTIMRRDPGTGIWVDIGIPAAQVEGINYLAAAFDMRINTIGDVAVTRRDTNPTNPKEQIAVYHAPTWIVGLANQTSQAWQVERGGSRFLGGKEVSGHLEPGYWTNAPGPDIAFTSAYTAFASQEGNISAMLGLRAVGVTALDGSTGPFYPLYCADYTAGSPVWSKAFGNATSLSIQSETVPVTTFQDCRLTSAGIAYFFKPDEGVSRYVSVFQDNVAVGNSAPLLAILPLSGDDSVRVEDARADGTVLVRSWLTSSGESTARTATWTQATGTIEVEATTHGLGGGHLTWASAIADDGAILGGGRLAVPIPTVSLSSLDSAAGNAGETISITATRLGSTLVPLTVQLSSAVSFAEGNAITIPVGSASATVARTLLADLVGTAQVALAVAPAEAQAEAAYVVGGSPLTIQGLSGNQAPTVVITGATSASAGDSVPWSITLSDDSTAAGSIVLACTASSDAAIVDHAEVVLGGSGTTRTATIPVKPGAASGSVTLTFTATDGDGAVRTATRQLAIGCIAGIALGIQADEDAHPDGTFTVSLSTAAPAGGVAVSYAVSGTANAQDFTTAPSGTVLVPEGATSAQIPFLLTDDFNPEESETIVLTLSPGAGYGVGANAAATMTIPRSDVQNWVFWIERKATAGTDQGVANLVWWMTSVRPVASAVFKIPGKPDVQGEIRDLGDHTEIQYPFWQVFGMDAIASADLQAYLPVSAGATDYSYQCVLTFADGVPLTETRRGSFLGMGSGFPVLPAVTSPAHGGTTTLTASRMSVAWSDPVNWVSLQAWNGRDAMRDYWEGRPPTQGSGANSFTIPIDLANGQAYRVQLMRGNFAAAVGQDELGGYAGLAWVNTILTRPGATAAMPAFTASSDDLTTTQIGAIPAATGLSGSESAGGSGHAFTAVVTHEQVTIPGTATAINAVRLQRTWGDGVVSESAWLAKDTLGDVYALRSTRRGALNPTSALKFTEGPLLMLPATTSPAWYMGPEATGSVATGQTAYGSGATGCVRVRAAWSADDAEDFWFKPGYGWLSYQVTQGGSAGDGWYIDPPVSANPIPTLTSASGNPLNGAFQVACAFSQPVTGFLVGDITISGGTISAFTGSGASYSWTITPSAANVSASVAAGKCTAVSGGAPNQASNVLTRSYDAVRPTLVLSSPAGSQVSVPFIVNAVFSEAVAGFAAGDIVVANGVVSDFSGSGTTYSWTVVPGAAGGTVTVGVPANAASDVAGNGNTAAASLSRTADMQPPSVVLATTAPAVVKAAFTVTVTFNEAVTGFTVDDLVVAGASKGVLTTVTAGKVYSCVLTPAVATTGDITIDVPAAAAADAGGNPSQAAVTLTRIGDTVAPVLTLATEAGINVNGPYLVTITANEDITGLDAADLVLANATSGAVSVVDPATRTWQVEIRPILNGMVSVGVKAAAVLDTAGNANPSATMSDHAFADATPPTVVLASAVGSFANQPFTVTATFSEAPGSSFALADLQVVNGTASALAGTGLVRTCTITPAAQGACSVTLPAGAFTDPNAVASTAASNTIATIYDTLKPTPVISSAAAASVNGPFAITVAFAEPVLGFAAGDVAVTGGTLGDFTGGDGDSSFTATITPAASGTVTVAIAAGKMADRAGNAGNAATSLNRTIDRTRPAPTLASAAAAITNTSPIVVVATFPEVVSGLEAGDLVVVNASVSGLSSADGKVYSIGLTPTGDGTVSVQIPADAASDVAGNTNLASAVLARTSDRTVPAITLGSAAPDTVTGTFNVSIDCSEAVTGLVAADIAVANGVVTGFAGSGASYTCAIRPTAVGTVTVSIAGGAAVDVAGNPSSAATPLVRSLAVSNDAFADAIAIAGWSGSVSAANLGATAEAGEPAHAAIAASASVWWTWTAPESGTLSIDTLGSLIDTQLAVYTGSAVNALAVVGSNANASTSVVQSKVAVAVAKNGVYRIAVDGKSGAKGLLTLSWSLVAGNNLFTAARAIGGTSGSDTSGTWQATRDVGENGFGGLGSGQTVWWSYTAPATGVLHLSSAGSEVDTILGVATGTAVGSLVVIGLDDDVPGDVHAEVGLKVTAGKVYRIMIDASAAAAEKNGAVTLVWSLEPSGGG